MGLFAGATGNEGNLSLSFDENPFENFENMLLNFVQGNE